MNERRSVWFMAKAKLLDFSGFVLVIMIELAVAGLIGTVVWWLFDIKWWKAAFGAFFVLHIILATFELNERVFGKPNSVRVYLGNLLGKLQQRWGESGDQADNDGDGGV